MNNKEIEVNLDKRYMNVLLFLQIFCKVKLFMKNTIMFRNYDITFLQKPSIIPTQLTFY
jgi:hypothetical protein